MYRRRAPWVLAAALLLGLLLRWPLLDRPGLWVDEVFSLAIATGHSLEHPAHDANQALGDFVEGLAEARQRVARLLRARRSAGRSLARPARREASDTNPPLYYLALWA
jgi:hypothetical protein